MATLNRQTAKTFFTTLDKYEAVKKLVKRAVDPVNPSVVKSHEKNRSKLDDLYLEVNHDWSVFKRDLNQTSDVLNEKDEKGDAKYEHNDEWRLKFEEAYCDLVEKSDAVLDSISTVESQKNEEKANSEAAVAQKREFKLREELGEQMESLSTYIRSSIKRISEDVTALNDGEEGVSKIQAYKADLATILDRLDDKYIRTCNEYMDKRQKKT